VPVGTQNGIERIVNISEKGLNFSIFTKGFFSFIIKCNCLWQNTIFIE